MATKELCSKKMQKILPMMFSFSGSKEPIEPEPFGVPKAGVRVPYQTGVAVGI